MEENLQEDGVFAPVTPAKLGLGCRGLCKAGAYVQESLDSRDNEKLGRTNSDGHLFVQEDFCGGVGRKNSRTDDSSGKDRESGKNSCMQYLFSKIAGAKHEVIRTVQISSHLSAEVTVSVHNHAGVAETEVPSNVFGTEGLDSAPDLNHSQKQDGRKRKGTGIDLNKKPRQRMKKHRPKIFDASKPKKIPKAKKEKKNGRKSRKTTLKSESGSDPASNPPTPKPLHPKRIAREDITSCKEGKCNYNNGQSGDRKFDEENQGSSRRNINFGTHDQSREGSAENVVRDMSSSRDEHRDGNVADLKSYKSNELDVALVRYRLNVETPRKFIHTYQRRRWQKGGDKSTSSLLMLSLMLSSNSEPQDFGSSMEMRKIISEYKMQILPIQETHLLHFPTAFKRSRTRRQAHIMPIQESRLLDFPKAFKQKRTRRQRRTMYSGFPKAVKLNDGNIKGRWRRLEARSKTKRKLTFRSQIPTPFPLAVPKMKRSKIYTRRNLASKSDQTLSTSFPNLPIAECTLSTSFPNLPTVESTLSTPFPNLPITESFMFGNNSVPCASANTFGANTHLSMGKDGFPECFMDVLCVENQSSMTKNRSSVTNVRNSSSQGVFLDDLCVEYQSSVTNEAAEHFPVVAVISDNQIQKNNFGCDYGLLELKLGLTQYEDVTHSTMQDPLEQKNVPLNTVLYIPDPEDIADCTNDPCTKYVVDLIQKFECLRIMDESRQLVVRDQNSAGAMMRIDPRKGNKPKQPTPKVDLDQETMRVWNMLMENDGREDTAQNDEGKEKWWEEQRELFHKRIDSFIARMHLIQGDRRFSQWKGSVIDSVVGVFLTQNVSDYLSSSAYMSLASCFPPTSVSNDIHDEDKDTSFSQQSTGDNIEAKGLTNDLDSEKSSNSQNELHKNQELTEKGEETIVCMTEDLNMVSVEDERLSTSGVLNMVSAEDERLSTSGVQEFSSSQRDSINTTSSSQRTGSVNDLKDCTHKIIGEVSILTGNDRIKNIFASERMVESRVQEGVTCNCYTSLGNSQESLGCSLKEKVVTEDNVSSSNKHRAGKKGKKSKKNDDNAKVMLEYGTNSIKRKGKVDEKKDIPVNWDELRTTYSSGRNTLDSTMDSVDWKKVRLATVEKISNIISQRGMHNIIGKRIKNFLDRIVKDHGSIDLEWLRDVPPDKAKEYLLSIEGIGLKSVECVRLLTLHHHAFPVDTNVGRIAVRLGWVPLQPLPGDLEIDLLNNYPLVDSIQKYLWPRLCKLPQRILYELHYQMITFGKVFCTKKQPNCSACPLKGDCRHFASASARAQLRLPGPQEKNIIRTNAPYAVDDDTRWHATQSTVPFLKGSFSESIYGTQSCEPIIEHPASPEPEYRETLERDIEDLCDDSDGEIPTIRFNTEAFRENLLNFTEDTNLLLPECDMSKALIALTPEVASVPAPKLRAVSRLRTVHNVYELPDSHPLLEEFEEREADDPCPYLFAVWLSGDGIEEQNDQRVSGTILIPCRTANRGNFPLNGTYFQVNEVFADDKSNNVPISVPREWLWDLHQRRLYCGTSATSIFRGLGLLEIQYCFRKGFLCVRGFDRKTRAPRPLGRRFHLHGDKEVE